MFKEIDLLIHLIKICKVSEMNEIIDASAILRYGINAEKERCYPS